MKDKIRLLVLLLFFVLFLFICYEVKTNELLSFDYSIYNLLVFNDAITFIMKIITFMGSKYAVIFITLLMFFFIKNKKIGIYTMLNLILITIVQLVLKNIFMRPRPVDINLIIEEGYSFPSGHSLTAMSFYGFIIYLIYSSNINIKIKRLCILLLGILIFMIGLSRVYLGVHFVTDVIGGFIISFIFLNIYIELVKSKIDT